MSDFVGVTLKELDYSTSVQSISASGAGFVGSYCWGPIEQPTTITNSDNYAIIFGKPYDANKISYLTGASYLDYADSLRVVRVAGEGSKNATSINYEYPVFKLSSVLGTIEVGSTVSYNNIKAIVVEYNEVTSELKIKQADGLFIEGAELVFGNNATATLQNIVSEQYASINISDSTNTFVVNDVIQGETSGATGTVVEVINGTLIYKVKSLVFSVNEKINGSISGSSATVATLPVYVDYGPSGILIKNRKAFENMALDFKVAAKYAGELGNSLVVSICNSSTYASWKYAGLFDGAPEADEVHVVVVDSEGKFYNSFENNVLSKYAYLSTVPGSKDEQGQDNYFKKIINEQDGYIYFGSRDLEEIDFIGDIVLQGGTQVQPEDGDLIKGYNYFEDQEEETSLYAFAANYSTSVMNAIVSLVDKRQDMMAIFSPSELNMLLHSDINETVGAVKNWGDSITMSNRVILDSNWMYYYNRFDNEYVWIPCAGATTGINSRCDTVNNPWDSPMGFTRGTYLNVASLAWQPTKEARTAIYARSINPIYVSNQAGVVLMGDRTHVIKQSYFRQVAARKTLILIERGAVQYLMFYLGENNNRQTRQLVTSNLSSWLRNMGAAGAFRLAQVVCNDSNNPQQIIDEQKMRVLIRVLPQSSINMIELQVAVVNNVASFTENVIQGTF